MPSPEPPYALDIKLLGAKIRIKDRTTVYVLSATLLVCFVVAAWMLREYIRHLS